VGVAAVEDLAEQVGEQADDVVGDALLGGRGREGVDGDRDVGDLAAERPGDLGDRIGEGQRPGPGQLVDLADVPVVGQRRGRDVREVVGVDERLGGVAGRERDRAADHGVAPVRLAEVLREPGRAQNGQLGARVAHGLLDAQRLLLAAAGHEDEAPDAAHREAGE